MDFIDSNKNIKDIIANPNLTKKYPVIKREFNEDNKINPNNLCKIKKEIHVKTEVNGDKNTKETIPKLSP